MKSLMLFAAGALLPVSALFAQVAPAQSMADFSTVPALRGSWAYRTLQGASESHFMDTRGSVRLVLRCTLPARQVTLSRISAAPAASMIIWTTSAQRTLPARFDPRAVRVSAIVAAADPLLDAIAFSRGRFAISMPGSVPLVVAPAPEAARVFEDCRN